MNEIRFPAPLRPGDRIGITAPSAGVGPDLLPRLDFAVKTLQKRGYEVVLGECLTGTSHVSASRWARSDELTRMLLDPRIRAVVPPRGGSVAIDLLATLDWASLRAAEPTWMVGYSDISTLLTPITLLTGMATLHGANLLDTAYQAPPGMLNWLDLAERIPGAALTQTSPGRFHAGGGPPEWAARPEATDFPLEHEGGWRRLDSAADVEVSGRLIGGCLEVIANLAGTPYGDLRRFAERYSPRGLIIYIEVAGWDAGTVCRTLHGMRLAGFFDSAAAVLTGRTTAADLPTLTQDEAVIDALGDLGVPIIAGIECGHVLPALPLINGASATATLRDGIGQMTQSLA